MSYTTHNAVKGNNFFTHVITAAEVTATKVELDVIDDLGISGFSDDLEINGYVVQIFDQTTNVGRLVTDYDVTASGTVLTIAKGGTYALVEGDVITGIVY